MSGRPPGIRPPASAADLRAADLLTPGEAAELAGFKDGTYLARLAKAGRIAAVRTPGGHRRYPRAAVEAFRGTRGTRDTPSQTGTVS